MSKPPGILFIMKLYIGVVCQLKLDVFDRDSYFWKKHTVVFACNLIVQNC